MSDFERIIRDYHNIIFKICKAYSSSEYFDDLYQEMLIAIWKSLKNFNHNSKISTWVYKVVLNTALSYRKKENKKTINKVELQEADGNINEETSNNDKIELLYAALKKLRPEERLIILLHIEEKSNSEIAEIIGITNGNVRVRLSRIKKKLSEIIKQIKF